MTYNKVTNQTHKKNNTQEMYKRIIKKYNLWHTMIDQGGTQK